MSRVFALLFLVVSGAAFATNDEIPLTPEEHVALRAAEIEGMTMFRHDRAAWLATDVLLADRTARKDKRITGWVTQDVPDGLRVTFVGAKDGKMPYGALYRITVMDNSEMKPVDILDPPEELSAFENNAIAVRNSAMESGFSACSPDYNSVVLPPREGAREWTVYLLPGTKKPNEVPAGGTYRFIIDPENISAMTSRTYTKSCIVLDNKPDAVSLMITHLLDPTPTEAHVFWSLSAQKPLFVMTPQGALWKVNGAEIQLVKRKGE